MAFSQGAGTHPGGHGFSGGTNGETTGEMLTAEALTIVRDVGAVSTIGSRMLATTFAMVSGLNGMHVAHLSSHPSLSESKACVPSGHSWHTSYVGLPSSSTTQSRSARMAFLPQSKSLGLQNVMPLVLAGSRKME